MKITIATVTYGKRTHYLTRMLDAAKAQGACQAVVIDNGSADPISTILSERYGNWVHVHVLGRNSGSALGYKTAMEQALAHNAELILLLDDDNVLAGNCLIRLLNKWQNYAACGVATNDFAVHAVRLRQGGDPTCGVRFQQPQRNSFLGFHIAEMPYKFVRRLAPGC